MAPQRLHHSNQAQVPSEAKDQGYILGDHDEGQLKDHGAMGPNIKNCKTFSEYCESVYVPTLRPGQRNPRCCWLRWTVEPLPPLASRMLQWFVAERSSHT